MAHRPIGRWAMVAKQGVWGMGHVAKQILVGNGCLRNWMGEMTKKPIGPTNMERKHVFSQKNQKISPFSLLQGTLLNA